MSGASLLDVFSRDSQGLQFNLNYPLAGEASVTNYNGPNDGSEDIIIPSQVTDGTKTYTVTALIGNIFGYGSANSITIPDTVTAADYWWIGFDFTRRTVYLGNGLQDYGAATRSGNVTLVFKSDNPYWKTDANGNIYKVNSDNTSLTLSSVYYISQQAFTIPTAVYGMNVVALGDYIFNGKDLTHIDVPSSVTSIGSGSFCNLSGLVFDQGMLDLISRLETIPYSAFSSCSLLTIIPFSSALKSIGDNAFANCGATNITIPASVTLLGNQLFSGANLTSITVNCPSSLCVSGTSFNLIESGTPSPLLSNITFNNNDAEMVVEDGVVYIPVDSATCQLAFMLPGRSSTTFTVPAAVNGKNVVAISDGAFSLNLYVESITIGNNVATVGNNLFNGIKSITFSSPYITEIPGWLLASQSNLTNVTISSPITSIPDGLFYNDNNLATFTIPSSVTSIYNNSFTGCSSLATVNLENITYFGNGAFYECTMLNNITLNNSLTSINDNLFADCSHLSAIVLPATVTRLGFYSFANCAALTSVIIPENVNYIDAYCGSFSGCSSLKDVYFLGDNVNIYDVDNYPELVSGVAFYGIASNAVAYYVAGKSGWDKYSSANPPTGFSNIQTFVPDSGSSGSSGSGSGSSGSGDLDATNTDSQGIIYDLDSPNQGEASVYGYSGTVTSITIPSRVSKGGNTYSVTKINDRALLQKSFTSVSLPESIVTIGDLAFYDTPIRTLHLGPNVANVGEVIVTTGTLESYTVDPNNPTLCTDSVGSLYRVNTVTNTAKLLAVPAASLSLTLNNTYTVNTVTKGTVTYPVTEIASDESDGEFRNCSIGQLVFGDNVTYLGITILQGSTNLRNISFGNGITNVRCLFNSYCPTPTTLYIGASVTDINTTAFSTTLTSLTVNSNNTAYTYTNGILSKYGVQVWPLPPDVDNGSVTIPAGGASYGNVSGGVLTVAEGDVAIQSLSGSPSLSIFARRTATVQSGTYSGTDLAGVGKLKKTGAGDLTISSFNSGFTGVAEVAAGKLILGATGALGYASIELNGGKLEIAASGSVTNTIKAINTSAANIITSTATSVVIDALEKNGTVAQIEGAMTVNSISGSSANSDINLGDGTTSTADLTLVSSGSYTFNGPTTVNAGSTLTLQDGVSMANSDVTVNSGATLVLDYTGATISQNVVKSLILETLQNSDYTNCLKINVPVTLAAGNYDIINYSLPNNSSLPSPPVNYSGDSNFSVTAEYNDSSHKWQLVVVDNTPVVPTGNVCFPAKTPVFTDQGPVNIEQIDSRFHTIRNKKIVAITKTMSVETELVCIEKDALAKNCPNQTTLISQNHQVFFQGQMIKAKNLVELVEKVTFVPYTGEILYNVLLEEHDKMVVNNLIVETLHPENKVAKLTQFLKKVPPSAHNSLIELFNKYDRENRPTPY